MSELINNEQSNTERIIEQLDKSIGYHCIFGNIHSGKFRGRKLTESDTFGISGSNFYYETIYNTSENTMILPKGKKLRLIKFLSEDALHSPHDNSALSESFKNLYDSNFIIAFEHNDVTTNVSIIYPSIYSDYSMRKGYFGRQITFECDKEKFVNLISNSDNEQRRIRGFTNHLLKDIGYENRPIVQSDEIRLIALDNLPKDYLAYIQTGTTVESYNKSFNREVINLFGRRKMKREIDIINESKPVYVNSYQEGFRNYNFCRLVEKYIRENTRDI